MPLPLTGIQTSIFTFVHEWLLVRLYVQGSYCHTGALTIALMLHRMAFQMSGKVVALQLDNSTAKAYLCNQDGKFITFSQFPAAY